MFDSAYVGNWDLQGRDLVVTIARIVPGELAKAGTSKKDKAPIVFFEGKEKGMVLNKTNMKIIGGIVGSFKVKDWLGHAITLYPTTCQFGPNTVDCIRVRPTAPSKGRNGKAAPPVPPDGDPPFDDAGGAP
jgi:hypothetical protein